ncbi:multidrug resistance efflux pump [Luteibacter sp. Sphag1AF]|uniref:efflux RND transporter periplasmic adaptor subunit n=1 Tax=Luteibacter sp. Sphag1AF TaxID=2587031 RepID=UPI00183AF751|nr:efflux RND transporter periplasmic adaptor subunit [Luteibacter sp. Sphag1AF]MBB3228264.1 multidrug resistance efflux pump [Luteibacter sp. Sphag1AF]
MSRLLRKALPVAATLGLVAIAGVVASHMWAYYEGAPWTRDAHIRADTLPIAPDVSGLVSAVLVRDNQQVKRGDPLFEVDRARFELAVRRATAAVEEQSATLAQLKRQAARNHALSDLVATETVEEVNAKVAEAQARLHAAETAADTAKLDLERTIVRAPADGYLSDHVVRIGDYVAAGRAPFAMVDAASFHVDGYFEETRLHGVEPGQDVSIQVMGESNVLHGKVQSIAAGIADRERTANASMLPDINPTFNWVRLAQRIPVRITIDAPPHDLLLVAGRTATVRIERNHVHPAAPAATKS